MRIHHVLVASALALLMASPAFAQIRVRAPGTADSAFNAADCSAYIPMPLRRNACFACVNRGGRFHLASNTCHAGAPPPPPPPPAVAVARSVYDCNTVQFTPKRNRCIACVQNGGSFFVHSNGGMGHCNAPPPPPPPPVDRTMQRTVGECYSEIHNPDKRLRCQTCVQNGGTYFKHAGNGFGQCTMPTPPADQAVLRTIGDCTAWTHGGKRVRCVNCVQGGGTFFKHAAGGIGQCSMPAPPPPPPSNLIFTVGDCYSRIAHPGLRNHCRKCIHRGGRWDPGAAICR